MTFWCGSGSADPCFWLMDPDPAIFISDLQDANKNKFKKILFIKKMTLKKLKSHHNMQPNKLTRREYKGKIYVKNIRENSCRILNRMRIRIRNQLRVGSGSEKKHWFRSCDTIRVKKFFCVFVGREQSRAPDSCTRRLEPWRSWSRASSSPALPGSSPASRPPPSLSVSPAHFFS